MPPQSRLEFVGRTSNTSYYLAAEDILISVLPDAGLKDDETSARENAAFQIGVATRAGKRIGLVVYLLEPVVAGPCRAQGVLVASRPKDVPRQRPGCREPARARHR